MLSAGPSFKQARAREHITEVGGPASLPSAVVLLARDTPPAAPGIKDLSIDMSQWQPLIEDRAFVSWLVSRKGLRARKARLPSVQTFGRQALSMHAALGSDAELPARRAALHGRPDFNCAHRSHKLPCSWPVASRLSRDGHAWPAMPAGEAAQRAGSAAGAAPDIPAGDAPGGGVAQQPWGLW